MIAPDQPSVRHHAFGSTSAVRVELAHISDFGSKIIAVRLPASHSGHSLRSPVNSTDRPKLTTSPRLD